MVLTPTLELCEPEVRSGIEFSASFAPTLVFHSFWVLSNLADCNYGDASMYPIAYRLLQQRHACICAENSSRTTLDL